MADIDFTQVLKDCLEAAKGELGKSWKKYKPYAEHEIKQFAQSAEFLAKLRAAGEIDDEELQERIELQKLAFKNVLLTIEGIGLITAQKVTNLILKIVSTALQTALGAVI